MKELRATQLTLALVASEAKMTTKDTNYLAQNLTQKMKICVNIVPLIEGGIYKIIFELFLYLQV